MPQRKERMTPSASGVTAVRLNFRLCSCEEEEPESVSDSCVAESSSDVPRWGGDEPAEPDDSLSDLSYTSSSCPVPVWPYASALPRTISTHPLRQLLSDAATVELASSTSASCCATRAVSCSACRCRSAPRSPPSVHGPTSPRVMRVKTRARVATRTSRSTPASEAAATRTWSCCAGVSVFQATEGGGAGDEVMCGVSSSSSCRASRNSSHMLVMGQQSPVVRERGNCSVNEDGDWSDEVVDLESVVASSTGDALPCLALLPAWPDPSEPNAACFLCTCVGTIDEEGGVRRDVFVDRVNRPRPLLRNSQPDSSRRSVADSGSACSLSVR
mmetsp:Transcript_16600/g.51925  ORF Transcript_16600/g.51925 Transcript_16600/m.51925 type:complete len:329 (+) Transcript_16600:482-1468(+)